MTIQVFKVVSALRGIGMDVLKFHSAWHIMQQISTMTEEVELAPISRMGG